MENTKDLTISKVLKKFNMEIALSNKKEEFKKTDFELLITLLERNGYHTSYYNEDYEFDLYFSNILQPNNLIDKDKHYSLLYDFSYKNGEAVEISIHDAEGLRINLFDIYAYIKNDYNDLLRRKISYSHFTKNDFIKLINSTLEFIKGKNINIIEHEIVINGWRLIYKDVEELKNTTFDFRNLVVK